MLATFPAPLCVDDTQWGLSRLVLAQWGEKWGVKKNERHVFVLQLARGSGPGHFVKKR